MKTELTEQQTNVAPVVDGMLAMVERAAADPNVDIAKMERLYEMYGKMQEDQAKKSFFTALSRFQSIVPSLKKSKQGHNYKYTPLGDIAEQIREPPDRDWETTGQIIPGIF